MRPARRNAGGGRAAGVVTGAVAAALAFPGCAEEERSPLEPTPPPRAVGLIDFPAALRADDPEVNVFLFEAFRTCADKDYEAFRLLWSVREDPMSEEEFMRGWQADPSVSIKGLQKMRTPQGGIVYAVRALVQLDPRQVPEPDRDIVFLLVKENGKWRVASAPRSVAKAMKREDKGGADDQHPQLPVTTPAPTDSAP